MINFPLEIRLKGLYKNHMLKSALLNARSISNKMPEINLCLNTFNLDILIATETWLTNEIPPSSLGLDQKYKILTSNRKKERIGGGCAVIYKKELNFSVILSKSIFNCEVLILKFLGKIDLKIICVYRPPKTSFKNSKSALDNTKSLLKLIESNILGRTIILGDFNFNDKDIVWNNNKIPLPQSQLGAIFLEFF